MVHMKDMFSTFCRLLGRLLYFLVARDECSLVMLCADDYRLFCGDLGNEVNDDVLSKAFSRFPSFNMARVSNLSDSAIPL